MKNHDATEQAYKNGYEQGYKNGRKDAIKSDGCEYCNDTALLTGAKWQLGNDGQRHSIRFCPNCGRMIKNA